MKNFFGKTKRDLDSVRKEKKEKELRQYQKEN
jgi:hypothetical protein